jgi:phage replication O-like protein O
LANPQLENGHTRISNEILEALASHNIPSEPLRVALFVIRKTYGYHKKWDKISRSQFAEGTGIKRRNVSRAIKAAEELGILLRDASAKKHPTDVITWSLQKDYKQWVPPTPPIRASVLDDAVTSGPEDADASVIEDAHKRNKERNILACFEHAWEKYPKKLGKKDALRHFKASVKNERNWIDIQTALKKYNTAVIGKPIRYIQNGSTWFNNWEDWVKYTGEEPVKEREL